MIYYKSNLHLLMNYLLVQVLQTFTLCCKVAIQFSSSFAIQSAIKKKKIETSKIALSFSFPLFHVITIQLLSPMGFCHRHDL